jgi:hypothetical protein
MATPEDADEDRALIGLPPRLTFTAADPVAAQGKRGRGVGGGLEDTTKELGSSHHTSWDDDVSSDSASNSDSSHRHKGQRRVFGDFVDATSHRAQRERALSRLSSTWVTKDSQRFTGPLAVFRTPPHVGSYTIAWLAQQLTRSLDDGGGMVSLAANGARYAIFSAKESVGTSKEIVRRSRLLEEAEGLEAGTSPEELQIPFPACLEHFPLFIEEQTTILVDSLLQGGDATFIGGMLKVPRTTPSCAHACTFCVHEGYF